jgi:hypothetical protein
MELSLSDLVRIAEVSWWLPECRKPTGGFWRSAQQQGSDLFDRFLEA